jgi:hypothetical protein
MLRKRLLFLGASLRLDLSDVIRIWRVGPQPREAAGEIGSRFLTSP